MKFGYNIPIFFEDCSNPITLRYENLDLVKNFKIGNSEILKYDGSLLKTARIDLEDLQTIINLRFNILDSKDELHSIDLKLDIPFENQTESIYDGFYEQKNEKLNLKF